MLANVTIKDKMDFTIFPVNSLYLAFTVRVSILSRARTTVFAESTISNRFSTRPFTGN